MSIFSLLHFPCYLLGYHLIMSVVASLTNETYKVILILCKMMYRQVLLYGEDCDRGRGGLLADERMVPAGY